MKKLIAALSILVGLYALAANVPLRNRFEGPIQSDVGIMCSNVASGGTAWTMEPCGSGTDAANPFTSGKLFAINGDPDGDGTFEQVCYETWNGRLILPWDDDGDTVQEDGERGAALRVYGMSTDYTADGEGANGSSNTTALISQTHFDNSNSSAANYSALSGSMTVADNTPVRGNNNYTAINGTSVLSGDLQVSTFPDLIGVYGKATVTTLATAPSNADINVVGVEGTALFDGTVSFAAGRVNGVRAVFPEIPSSPTSPSIDNVSALWVGGIATQYYKNWRPYRPYGVYSEGPIVTLINPTDGNRESGCEDGPEIWIQNNSLAALGCNIGDGIEGGYTGFSAPIGNTITNLPPGTATSIKYQWPADMDGAWDGSPSTQDGRILMIEDISLTREFVLDSTDPDTAKVRLEWADPAALVSSGGGVTGSGNGAANKVTIWKSTTEIDDQVAATPFVATLDPHGDGTSGIGFMPYVLDSDTDGTYGDTAADYQTACPLGSYLRNVTKNVSGTGNTTAIMCQPHGGVASCLATFALDGGIDTGPQRICQTDLTGSGTYGLDVESGYIVGAFYDYDLDGTEEDSEMSPLRFVTYELDGTTNTAEYSVRAMFTAGNLVPNKGKFTLLDADFDGSGNEVGGTGTVSPDYDSSFDVGKSFLRYNNAYVKNISSENSSLTVQTDGSGGTNKTRLTFMSGLDRDDLVFSNLDEVYSTDGPGYTSLGTAAYPWGASYFDRAWTYGQHIIGTAGLDSDIDGTSTCISGDDATDRVYADKDCDAVKDAGEEWLDEAGAASPSGTASRFAMFDSDGTGLADAGIADDGDGGLILYGQLIPATNDQYVLGQTGNRFIYHTTGSVRQLSYLQFDSDQDGTGSCITEDEAALSVYMDKDCDSTQDAGEEYLDEAGGSVTFNADTGSATGSTITIAGGTGIDTTGDGTSTVTVAVDSTEASFISSSTVDCSSTGDGAMYVSGTGLKYCWDGSTLGAAPSISSGAPAYGIGSCSTGAGYVTSYALDCPTGSGWIPITYDATSAAFKDVTGDIDINSDGTTTIQSNSVALGTDTTGNYIATIAPATGTIANAESKALSLAAGTGITVDGDGTSTITIGSDLTLDEIGNPGGNKTFTMVADMLQFTYTNPAPTGSYEGAFEIEATGNFGSGAGDQDLVHIHQHTGNAGTMNALHVECTDADCTPVKVAGDSSTGLAISADDQVLGSGFRVDSDQDGTYGVIKQDDTANRPWWDKDNDGTIDSGEEYLDHIPGTGADPSGTANTVAQFDSDGTGLTNSDLTYDGTVNTLDNRLTVKAAYSLLLGGDTNGDGTTSTVKMANDTDFVVSTYQSDYGIRSQLKLTSAGATSKDGHQLEVPYKVVWQDDDTAYNVAVQIGGLSANRTLTLPNSTGTILTTGTTTTYTGVLDFSNGIGRSAYLALDTDADSTYGSIRQEDTTNRPWWDKDNDGTIDSGENYMDVAGATAVDADSDATNNVSISSPAVVLDGDDDGATDVEIEADSFDYDQDGTAEETAALDFGDGYPQHLGNPFSSRVVLFDELIGTPTTARCVIGSSGGSSLSDADPQTTSSQQFGTACSTGSTLGNDGHIAFNISSNTTVQYLIADKLDHFAVRAQQQYTTQKRMTQYVGGIRTSTNGDFLTKTDGIFFWCDPQRDLDNDGTAGDIDSDGTGTTHPDGDCSDAGEDADDCKWYAVTMNNAADNASGIISLSTNTTATKTTADCSTSGSTVLLDVIEIKRNGSAYEYYLNGAQLASISTNIPSDLRKIFGWAFGYETREASSHVLAVDWIYYSGRR